MRTLIRAGLTTVLMVSMGCEPAALAHRPLPVPAIANPSPYRVDLVGEHGETLTTYHHRGRYYVLGQMGGRYGVRVSNPTGRRVEVVVSIDGLDAVDGKTAGVGKRGYVLPAYGDVTIEGFRTSTENVAAFRFASVAESYAGRKGQARNVGVIGVAFFEEQEQALSMNPPEEPQYDEHRHSEREHFGGVPGEARATRQRADSAKPSAMPAGPPTTRSKASAGEAAPSRDSLDDGSSHYGSGTGYGSGGGGGRRAVSRSPRVESQRPGLGTEFGESRSSRVSYTSFRRAHETRPTAVAELRYDNAAGLAALGIPVPPRPDPDDRYLRETANPFPGSAFAAPPPGYR